MQHAMEKIRLEKQQMVLDAAKKSPWFRASAPVFWVRLFFDGVLPVGLAAIALPLLWNWKPPC